MEARERLAATTAEYREEASASIQASLLASDEYKAAQKVLVYSAIGREVSTTALIDAMLADGKKVCLPRCIDIGADGKRIPSALHAMEARYVTADTIDRLSEGAYGIKEPDDRIDTESSVELFPLADPGDIDLIVLPCVSCDRECNRLGHGAGYYDKFLSTVRETCATVALCYDKLISDHIPTEDHDMKVNAVISEKSIYRWRP